MSRETFVTQWEFDTEHLAPELRFEAWSDAMSGCGKYLAHENSSRSNIWQSNIWTAGPLLLTTNKVGAFRGKRDPDSLRRANFEHISMRYIISGVHNAIFLEEPALMREGEVHLYDMNVPYYSETPTELASIVVILPYTSIGYDPSIHPAHIGLSANSPGAMLIKSALLQFRESLATLNHREAPAVLQGFCGLLRGLLFPRIADEEARQQVEKAKFILIKKHIEQNIHDPTLGTEHLCKTFAVSRAQIYRMFAAEKGVTSYINRRRMIHAFRQFGSSEPSRGIIRTVAEQYGFYDQGHFSRLFRSNFQIAPSDALGMWREQSEEDASPILNWGEDHAQYLSATEDYWNRTEQVA